MRAHGFTADISALPLDAHSQEEGASVFVKFLSTEKYLANNGAWIQC